MNLLLLLFFLLGYLAIILEHPLGIHKSASALITGVLCWLVVTMNMPQDVGTVATGLIIMNHLGDISGILFFLLGAMVIVELIDAHDGFDVIRDRITTANKRTLLLVITILAFFLSAALDNLTTTIVMVALMRKLMKEGEDRLMFAGMIVIAANAGGAWSPIGDVTTTMLWIGGQVTALSIMLKLILPSLACVLVPLVLLSLRMKGPVEKPELQEEAKDTTALERSLVLSIGLGGLLFVPVFKMLTGLPPFMGMLFSLGMIWLITDLLHRGKSDEDKAERTPTHALRKIDSPSILFFLGILLSISALEFSGVLHIAAHTIETTLHNQSLIVMTIGLASAVVDNVPLVAAAQGMFNMLDYPQNHFIWEFLAYTTGTGGSALIIGSAAGVAAMGMENISFLWYFKKISWLALVGFLAGAGVYLLQNLIL